MIVGRVRRMRMIKGGKGEVGEGGEGEGGEGNRRIGMGRIGSMCTWTLGCGKERGRT